MKTITRNHISLLEVAEKHTVIKIKLHYKTKEFSLENHLKQDYSISFLDHQH